MASDANKERVHARAKGNERERRREGSKGQHKPKGTKGNEVGHDAMKEHNGKQCGI